MKNYETKYFEIKKELTIDEYNIPDAIKNTRQMAILSENINNEK